MVRYIEPSEHGALGRILQGSSTPALSLPTCGRAEADGSGSATAGYRKGCLIRAVIGLRFQCVAVVVVAVVAVVVVVVAAAALVVVVVVARGERVGVATG